MADPELFPRQLPASWAGVDLTYGAEFDFGNFAKAIRESRDPLFGLPEMPQPIEDAVTDLLRESEAAREFYPYLVQGVACCRDKLKHEVKDPDAILAAGLRHSASDWDAWSRRVPPPIDSTDEDDA